MPSKPDSQAGDDISIDDTEVAAGALESPAADSLYSASSVRMSGSVDDARDDGPLHVHGDLDELLEVDPSLYDIADEMARGGMGRIMEGRDRRAGRPVAIKEVLGPLLKAFPESDRQILLRRFEREARITAGLQHPAIVPVYEIGRFGDMPFFAMKKVHGRPLDKVIADLDSIDARLALLPKLIAIADALAYAHERGVIHRDLKPANVLVGAHGETVVIDWGLAKQLDDDDAAPSRPPVLQTDDGLQTVAGSVFGTPHYMPPEQALGIETDRSADVYAIGAMLYHLLAGFAPYRDGAKKRSQQAVLDALLDGPPTPLLEIAPTIPKDLVSIVEKAMARDSGDRYADATGLADDLRQFQAGVLVAVHDYSTTELFARWVRRHRAAVATGSVALLVVVVLGTFGLLQIRAERDRAQLSARDARERTAQAVRILTEGGQDALIRGDMVDAAFRLIQAKQLGSDASELPVLIGELAKQMGEEVVRLDGDTQTLPINSRSGASFFILPFRSGRIDLRRSDTGELVNSFTGPTGLIDVTIDDAGTLALINRRFPDPPQLWDPVKGEYVRTIKCEQRGSTLGLVTQDGSRAVLLCPDTTITVIDTRSGEALRSVPTSMMFRQVQLSRDAKLLMAGLGGFIVRYHLDTLEVESRGVTNIAASAFRASADLSLGVVASGQQLTVIDFVTKEQRKLESEAGDAWYNTEVSADGSVVVGRDESENIVIFGRDGSRRNLLRVSDFAEMAINEDGSILAISTYNGLIRLWDVKTGHLRASYIGVSIARRLSWVSPRGLVAQDGDRGALFIDASSDRMLAGYHSDEGAIYGLQYVGDTKLVTTIGKNAYAFSTNAARDSVLTNPIDLGANIMSRTLASVSADNLIVMPTGIYDLESGAHQLTVPFVDGDLIQTTMSSNEATVMIANASELVAYRTRDGAVIRRIKPPNPTNLPYLQVMGAVLTADGRTTIFATSDGNIFTADLASDEEPVLLGIAKGVRRLYIDPSSKRLLASSRPDALWDLESRKKLLDLPYVSVEATFTPDGRYIVRRQNVDVEVRDARDGSLVHELPKFFSTVTSMSVTNELILTTSLPGEIHVWRVDTGAIVYRQRHGNDIRIAALNKAGSEYAIASPEHLYVYRIPRSDDSPEKLVDRLQSVFDSKVFRLRYVLDKPGSATD